MQSAFLTFNVETHKTRALLNVLMNDFWWALVSWDCIDLEDGLVKIAIFVQTHICIISLQLWLCFIDFGRHIIVTVVDTWENSFDYERSVNCKCSTVNVWLGRFIQLSAWRLPAQEAPSVSPIIMLLNAADNNNLDIAWEQRQGRRRVAWRRRRRRAVWSGGEDRRPAFTS